MIVVMEKVDKRGQLYQWSSRLDGNQVTTEYGIKGKKTIVKIKLLSTDHEAAKWWTSKWWEKLQGHEYKISECILST